VRIPRGSHFVAGDAIGTLNAMNHVHLIAGRNGHEINALSALQLPGIGDSIPPVIEEVRLYDASWVPIELQSARLRLPDKVRIVIQAYDRMDGNSDRRRLGVYGVGYHIFSHDTPFGEIQWRVTFDRTPSNDAVRLAYAEGSRSGYTPDTIFNYIATNRVSGDEFGEDFLDTSQFPAGRYTLRVTATDYFGNVSSKDVDIVK
jgi:hypothetical protein